MEEIISRAESGHLPSCQVLVQHYLDEDKTFSAIPYAETLAKAGKKEYYNVLSSLYCDNGVMFLHLRDFQNALACYENALSWAKQDNNEEAIVKAQRGIGECYYLSAVHAHNNDEKAAEDFYVEACNTLADTIDEDDEDNPGISSLIWAICVEELSRMGGYEFSQGAITKKIKIFLNAYKNRETLRVYNPYAEAYLGVAMVYLGYALLTEKEYLEHHKLAYRILTVAKQEYGANIDLPITDSFGHDIYDAITLAKKLVKGTLKAPSTALFCSVSEADISCENNTWTVKGWVEAENTYGGRLQVNFVVKFTFTKRDQFRLDYCKVE